MLIKFNRRDGQTVLEYSVLITVLLAAFLGMGIYFKRGVSGRWREVSDGLGDQYDPRKGKSSVKFILHSNTETQIYAVPMQNGKLHTRRIDKTNSAEYKTGFQGVGPY